MGRGCTVLKAENVGSDLVVTFNGQGNGIQETEFAPKLIGKNKEGKLLYGYARLPYLNYLEPILSARAPVLGKASDIEVQNFGQSASLQTMVQVSTVKEGKEIVVATGSVPPLKPYEKTTVALSTKVAFELGKDWKYTVAFR